MLRAMATCVATVAGVAALGCCESPQSSGPACELPNENPVFEDRLLWERTYDGIGESGFTVPTGMPTGGVVVRSRADANALMSFDGAGEPVWTITPPEGAQDVHAHGDIDAGLAVVGVSGAERQLWQYDFEGQLTNAVALGPRWSPGANGECDVSRTTQQVVVAPRGEVAVTTEVTIPGEWDPENGDCSHGSTRRFEFEFVAGGPELRRDSPGFVYGVYDRIGRLAMAELDPGTLTRFTADYAVAWDRPLGSAFGLAGTTDGTVVFLDSSDHDDEGVDQVVGLDEAARESWRADSEVCERLAWTAPGADASVYVGSNFEERSWVRKHDAAGNVEWIHAFEPGRVTSAGAVDGAGSLFVVRRTDGDPASGWIARLDP